MFNLLLCTAICVTSATQCYCKSEQHVPKFKKGDCVQDLEDLEGWEKPKFPVIKILDIGIKKYKTVYWISEENRFDSNWSSDPIWIVDTHHTKVRCPK